MIIMVKHTKIRKGEGKRQNVVYRENYGMIGYHKEVVWAGRTWALPPVLGRWLMEVYFASYASRRLPLVAVWRVGVGGSSKTETL